jgi:hypothetical protein
MLYILVGMALIVSADRLIRREAQLVERQDQSYVRNWLLVLIDSFLIIAGVTFIIMGSTLVE